jgi:hypothetical protein
MGQTMTGPGRKWARRLLRRLVRDAEAAALKGRGKPKRAFAR